MKKYRVRGNRERGDGEVVRIRLIWWVELLIIYFLYYKFDIIFVCIKNNGVVLEEKYKSF